MTGYTSNDKLLIHYFQDSLSGSTTRWYNLLSRDQIQSWMDLAKAFLIQYKHMMDIAPDRISLQNMEKTSETFREYAHKWQDLATQVQPPLTDKELNKMFLNTLKMPYYDRMIGNSNRFLGCSLSQRNDRSRGKARQDRKDRGQKANPQEKRGKNSYGVIPRKSLQSLLPITTKLWLPVL